MFVFRYFDISLNRASGVRHFNQSEINLHKIKDIMNSPVSALSQIEKAHVMDDLSLFHVLAPVIQEIGNGVRLSGQDEIASRTFVCFLDRNLGFHYGFGYKNGSNLRVVCWENNNRRNRTVPKGAFVIAFDQVTTRNAFNAVNATDFDNPWFGDNEQGNVREELRALNRKQDRVADLIQRIAGLTIQQMDIVNQKIDELQRNN